MMRRFFWIAAFLLTLLYFYQWLPHIWRGSLFALIMSALLLFFFLLQSAIDFRIDDWDRLKSWSYLRRTMLLLPLIPAVCLAFVIQIHQKREKQEELAKKTQITCVNVSVDPPDDKKGHER